MRLTEFVRVYVIDRFTSQKQNMDLINTLNTLGNRIYKWYPEINEGGCCVFASIVGKELQQRNIPVRIIVAARQHDRKNIDKLRARLPENSHSGWNSVGIRFNHVGVEFDHNGKTYHYDSNGVIKKGRALDGYRIYPGRLTVEEAIGLAKSDDGWNDCFPRRQIPSLQRHIKKYLAKQLVQ